MPEFTSISNQHHDPIRPVSEPLTDRVYASRPEESRQSGYYQDSIPENRLFNPSSTNPRRPPQSTFEPQSFLERGGFPESSSDGWNDVEPGRFPSYRYGSFEQDQVNITLDYNHVRYSQGGSNFDQTITSDPHACQQQYYFYQGVPMSGPSPSFVSAATFEEYRNSTTVMPENVTDHNTNTSSSSASPMTPSRTAGSSSNTLMEKVQCTFAYYEPPRFSEMKTATKKKKPAMACLFCRVRKIACAPPIPGSSETRCNQCARREMSCQYPKESKRGQYRRLQYLERVGKEVAEKIAEVERQSAELSANDKSLKKGARKLYTVAQPYC